MALTLWSCYACLWTATTGSVVSVQLWGVQCWSLHASLHTLPLHPHFLSFWAPQLTPHQPTACISLLASTTLAPLRVTLYPETTAPLCSRYFTECAITITDWKSNKIGCISRKILFERKKNIFALTIILISKCTFCMTC